MSNEQTARQRLRARIKKTFSKAGVSDGILEECTDKVEEMLKAYVKADKKDRNKVYAKHEKALLDFVKEKMTP